ncbi:MAG: hypothetical protein JW810_05565 [Sedimentisphaerales bacterium]|nr:hypothetical protein [Sedimentisphaerales bacterium]
MPTFSELILFLLMGLGGFTGASAADGADVPVEPAQRALYEVEPAPGQTAPTVTALEVAVAPAAEKPGSFWYHLVGTKANGQSYRQWFLAQGDPLAPSPTTEIIFHRYILQEAQQPPLEYIDGYNGKACIPWFGFVAELLPRGTEPFPFAEGTYLGHPIVRRRLLPAVELGPPDDVRPLVLRTDLLVVTSRRFRDDGQQRKGKSDDYRYVPFGRDDYEQMIAAGINSFIVDGEQVDWVSRRAVFYRGRDPRAEFPEELYRSNFRGLRMYLDEPACRLAGAYPPEAPPAEAVKMIQEHIRQKMRQTPYRDLLVERGIACGSLKLPEPPLAIWETHIETGYYQMEANPGGIVQECRWRIDPAAASDQILMLQRINEQFDVDIPVTPDNLFLWFYSQMRGSSRVLGTRWGMSIYGQAAEPLRWPSMKRAYDLGAEYIWFWTSDHDHHVPYAQQLQLARQLAEYAASRPRRDLDALRRAAATVIVLPYGYTLPTQWQLHIWGTHLYPLTRKNRFGLTYQRVLAPAVKQIARCLKEGISYDVVPAGEAFDPRDYAQVIWISEKGER